MPKSKKIPNDPIPEEATFDQIEQLLQPLEERQYLEDELTALQHQLRIVRIRTEFHERFAKISARDKPKLINLLCDKYQLHSEALNQTIK